MLSTERWDNCEKPPLLFQFTALTCDENPNFRQIVFNLLAQSVDKTDAVRSFISTTIPGVTIVTLFCFMFIEMHLTL